MTYLDKIFLLGLFIGIFIGMFIQAYVFKNKTNSIMRELVIRHKLKNGQNCKSLHKIDILVKKAGIVYQDALIIIESKPYNMTIKREWVFFGLIPKRTYFRDKKEYKRLHDLVKEVIYGVDGTENNVLTIKYMKLIMLLFISTICKAQSFTVSSGVGIGYINHIGTGMTLAVSYKNIELSGAYLVNKYELKSYTAAGYQINVLRHFEITPKVGWTWYKPAYGNKSNYFSAGAVLQYHINYGAAFIEVMDTQIMAGVKFVSLYKPRRHGYY